MGGYHKAHMEIQKPARTFKLKIDNETTEVVMSFALFQEIMKVIPNPENVTQLLVQDFYLREYVIRRVLTGNKAIVSDDDLFDLFAHEVDEEAANDLILWVTDHILYFFTTTAEKSVKLGVKYQEQITNLTQSVQSQTGSED